jgi:hypothetical protein
MVESKQSCYSNFSCLGKHEQQKDSSSPPNLLKAGTGYNIDAVDGISVFYFLRLKRRLQKAWFLAAKSHFCAGGASVLLQFFASVTGPRQTARPAVSGPRYAKTGDVPRDDSAAIEFAPLVRCHELCTPRQRGPANRSIIVEFPTIPTIPTKICVRLLMSSWDKGSAASPNRLSSRGK